MLILPEGDRRMECDTARAQYPHFISIDCGHDARRSEHCNAVVKRSDHCGGVAGRAAAEKPDHRHRRLLRTRRERPRASRAAERRG